jgi:hypothetical protein
MGIIMAGIEDRAPWLRPYDARKDNEVEKNRAEHVFTNLKTESDLREQYSAGLFYGIIAGIAVGAVVTLIVIWCVALVYLA